MYIGATDRIVTLGAGADDGAVGENDNVMTENVTTGNGDDVITGDGGANVISTSGRRAARGAERHARRNGRR